MAMIFKLPGNEEAFRQAVMAAQQNRGNYLTEAEMVAAAQATGAKDPFPIGMPVSNQQFTPPPRSRASVEEANMREAMQRKLAEREAGIRAYEQQTGPRPGAPAGQADQIFANRTQNLMEGRGLIPDKRAEYLLQQRENEATRNKALAAAQQYVQSQTTALMRLEDYRDPQGAFERRMQERAFGLAEQRESGAAADRAEALRMRGEGLGLQREGLGIEREKIASQERLASEGLKRDDARESRKEDLQLRLLEIQERLNNARADRNVNFQRELQTEKINAEKELAEMTAKTRASEADAERKADLLEKFTALPEAEWRKLAPATIAHLAKQGIPVPAQYHPGANEQPRVPLAREQMKPDLEAEWDTISTAEGGGKSSLRDFIMQTPAEDIANNLDDYERYIRLKYPQYASKASGVVKTLKAANKVRMERGLDSLTPEGIKESLRGMLSPGLFGL